MEAGTQWVDNPNPPPVQDMAGALEDSGLWVRKGDPVF